jgi:RNA polymerase sigma-70 factor (family 1)
LDNYKTYSDEQLFQLLKVDDEVAFSEIYNRYWDKLYAFASAKSFGNEIYVHEIVQDVFIDLWTKRNLIDLKYSLYSYIAAMVRYRLLKVFARERREAQHKSEIFLTLPTTVSADYLGDIRDIQERIRTTIGALPERTKLAFLMSREQDLSYKEIAAGLGVSQKAVEGHISLALKKLRAALRTLFSLLAVIYTV